MTKRYVALGSSMAAGPGIPPRARDAPLRAARSAANYPHLVAERLGLDLVDVTYSGATTANVLTDRQHGSPPQAGVLDGSEVLVTVTIGGNDVGYAPLLTAAGLPPVLRSAPLLGDRLRELLDPTARDRALVAVEESLTRVGRIVRQRAPRARVFFVDYLTVLPPAGQPAAPVSDVDAALGRRVAATLERLTAEAAAANRLRAGVGCRRKPRPPRVVGAPVDGEAVEVRRAAAGPTGSRPPQRRWHAGGGRSGHRASRKSAQRSPIMIDGALVLARGIRGSAEASATRRLSTPRTRSLSSSGLSASPPMATLQAG
jgi:lysophospholipase L1-like esterase